MKCSPVLIGALLSCACAAPRALEDGERALLRRAAGTVPTSPWSVSGDYRDGSGDGTFEDHFTPSGFFSRLHQTRLPGGVGRDARGDWILPADGLARPAGGSAARESRLVAELLGGTWPEWDLRRGEPGRLEVYLDGQAVAEVELEARTHLPRRLRFLGDRSQRSYTFSEWTSPLGLALPGRVELTHGGRPVARWMRRTAVLTPGACAPPPPPRDTTFAQVGRWSELTTRRAGTRLVVRASPGDGVAGWWLIDTGAGTSILDRRRARGLALTPITQGSLVDAQGRVERPLVRLGELDLEAMQVRGLPLLVSDLSGAGEGLGLSLDGILGNDLLMRAVFELDFSAGRVRLIDAESFDPPPEATAVAFDPGAPVLQASFAPGEEGRLRLDTGSDSALIFHGPAVRRWGLTRSREDLETVRVRGLEGEVLADRGPHPWLRLAGRRFESVPATYMRFSRGALDRADLAGNLGAAFFRERRLTLALSHGCIVID